LYIFVPLPLFYFVCSRPTSIQIGFLTLQLGMPFSINIPKMFISYIMQYVEVQTAQGLIAKDRPATIILLNRNETNIHFRGICPGRSHEGIRGKRSYMYTHCYPRHLKDVSGQLLAPPALAGCVHCEEEVVCNFLLTVHTSCHPTLQHHNSYNGTQNHRQ
jgi:hypothetical protein